MFSYCARLKPSHSTLSTRFGGVGLILVFLGALPLSAQVYDVVELPTLPGHAESAATALSNAGKIVGISTDAGGRKVPVVWSLIGNKASRPVSLATLGAGSATPWDINDAGLIVGQAEDAEGKTVACSWPQPGTLVPIDTGESFSVARSVNQWGDVAGYIMQDRSVPGAFLIRGGVFGLLDETQATHGGGVNDFGQVVANYVSEEETRPFVRTGTVTVALDQISGRTFSEGFRINNRHQVIGSALVDEEEDAEEAARWDAAGGPPTLLGGLGGGFSQALGLNHFNQIVGISHVPAPSQVAVPTGGSSVARVSKSAVTFVNEPERAFLINGPGGSPVNLNNLISTKARWILLAATAINDRGIIVGHGLIESPVGIKSATKSNYTLRGYVLVPRGKQPSVLSLYLGLPMGGGKAGEPVVATIHANHAFTEMRLFLNGVVAKSFTALPCVHALPPLAAGTYRLKAQSLSKGKLLTSTETDLVVAE